ncbi:hypothetical protein BDN71DRAFT_1433942 [Pleurotus eryngii]|uniref:Ribonuclease H1 N-terminal domain-containing protein n=1 Tax=Pleurotus eryngii TaxID=5323 RepID=A0A9P5ZQ15_PLEER|nr:hypothetical protein BDN71DRAFT_1433942 [Pleurotus eryngii]
MQTTLADLLEMLSQLDLSTVVDIPPGVSVLIAGLNATMSAPAQAATPAVTSAPAVAATTPLICQCQPQCSLLCLVNPTVAPVPASSDAPPPPGTPARTTPCLAAPSMPSAESTMSSSSSYGSFIPPPGSPSGNAVASSSLASANSRWYSVTYGQKIGVFRDWYGVVEPLVNGVPGWKCKSFSTLAAATTHFNACAAAGITGVHVD